MSDLHNRHSLKAGILQMVLVISLILAVFTSSIILYVFLQQKIIQRQNVTLDLRRNALSGFNVALADERISYNQPVTFDLYQTGSDSVKIIKKPWGLFDYVSCTAGRGKKAAVIKAIVGAALDSLKQTALYVQDERLPLSLAGKTYIRGNAYLPVAGVKRAYMHGADYEGDKLIYGESKTSKAAMPELSKALADRITYYAKGAFTGSENIAVMQRNGKNLRLAQPFDSTTLVIRNTYIDLANSVLQGNIIVQADEAVMIRKTAILDGILVIAPVIILAENVSCNAQFFATDTLIMGNGCSLTYPSIVSVASNAASGRNSYLKIGEKCRINGIVLLFDSEKENQPAQTNALLELAKESSIAGYAFADALVSLSGSIYGTLICRQFILNTSGSFYQNYLLNATIDVTKRSPYFETSSFLTSSKTKKVIRWLP